MRRRRSFRRGRRTSRRRGVVSRNSVRRRIGYRF